MPFLEVTNPQINWKRKTIKIKYKGKLVDIPTLAENVVSTLQQPQSSSSRYTSKNSFAELEASVDVPE
jgi:hypothetical protein